MLTWLALHPLVRRPSRHSKIVNASAACGALTNKVAGTRTRAIRDEFVDVFPQARAVVDDLRNGRRTPDLAAMFWPSCAGGGFKSWECQLRHPVGPWGGCASPALAPAWRSHQNPGRGRDRRCLAHCVTATSSQGTQRHSTRVSRDGRLMLRSRKSPRSSTFCGPKRTWAIALFFDTLDELKSPRGGGPRSAV